MSLPAWAGYLVILVLGLSLVFIELFVPSGGLIGLAAALCVGYAIWAMFADGQILAGTVSSIVSVVYFVVVIRWGLSRLTMRGSLGAITATGDDVMRAQTLIGKVGTAVSDLRPAGIALVDGTRLDVMSSGAFIQSGAAIEIVEARGNRIMVRATNRSIGKQTPSGA
ncbi:MAG: NfeD family protein [Planctomycetota bacterium]